MANDIEITGIMLLIGLIIILFGLYLWNYLWISEYGGEMPAPQLHNEVNITYFNSKNFSFVVSELWKHFTSFDKLYLLRSCGIENYIYLLFQRRILYMLLNMSIISLLLSFVAELIKASEAEEKFFEALYDLLLNNKYINDYTVVCQLISFIIFSFLHFRNFSQLKNEVKLIYFERFEKMSREKNVDWLSCRTLHVSGILPEERNSIIYYN